MGKQCIGFGEFERKCPSEAGPNPNWCVRCNLLRIDHITEQFNSLAKVFDDKS